MKSVGDTNWHTNSLCKTISYSNPSNISFWLSILMFIITVVRLKKSDVTIKISMKPHK